jgi:transposase-like protein
MARGRKFTEGFKLQVVAEYESGSTLSALAKKYQLHPNQVLDWKRKAHQGDLVDQTPQLRSKDKEIKELRELIGKLSLEIEFLKKTAPPKRRRKSEPSSIISGPKVVPLEKDAG